MPGLSYKRVSKHLVLLGFAACADILDIPDQPTLVQANTASGCEESLLNPPPPKRDYAFVKVRACNFLSGQNCSEPVTGLTGTLCNTRDVECSNPVKQGTIRDVNGEFFFEVPTGGPNGKGFDGYLRITSVSGVCTDSNIFGAAAPGICQFNKDCDPMQPDEKNCMQYQFLKALVFFNPSVTTDIPEAVQVPLIPTAQSALLVAASDTKVLEQAPGFVFATVRDCRGQLASGAVLDLTPPPTVPLSKLYLSNGVPTAATMTDDSGTGGLLGVPQGFKTVIAMRSEDGKPEMGSAGIKVETQAGSYVNIILQPRGR